MERRDSRAYVNSAAIKAILLVGAGYWDDCRFQSLKEGVYVLGKCTDKDLVVQTEEEMGQLRVYSGRKNKYRGGDGG